MKSFGKKIIALIFIAALLVMLNPDLRKHQDKIIEKFKQENPLTGALGAGELVRNIVAYKNYYVFSLGKISATDETVSFGIAGFVIVYANMDLLKYKDRLQEMVK